MWMTTDLTHRILKHQTISKIKWAYLLGVTGKKEKHRSDNSHQALIHILLVQDFCSYGVFPQIGCNCKQIWYWQLLLNFDLDQKQAWSWVDILLKLSKKKLILINFFSKTYSENWGPTDYWFDWFIRLKKVNISFQLSLTDQ